MWSPEKQQQVTENFINKAKLECLEEFDRALRRIARLPFWSRWQAKRIAQEALGIGPFWNKGFKK